MEQTNLSQGDMPGGGLKIDMPFTMGAVWALLCTDVLQSLEYQTRPYELEPGQTDRVVQESVDHLCAVFRGRPAIRGHWNVMVWHLLTDYFRKALREIFKKFEAIEVDRLRPKPIVKITGEFYLQTVEGDPNYNIHRWLEQEGAEVYPAPIAVWFDYLIRVHIQKIQEYVGVDPLARYKLAKAGAVQRLLRWTYNRLRGALGDLPHELPDQYELRNLAAPYFHHRMSGGEGDMLIGKALWAHLHKKAHMICELSPYACLPNTMSIGAMAGVTGKYPDLLYAPIEIKGDAEVHALSRCQMVLTEARGRAITEFERALAGRTKQALLSKLDKSPRHAEGELPDTASSLGWHGREPRRASRLGIIMTALGIDVGSTTVKAVLVRDGQVVWRDYQRHNTRQAEKVLEFLKRLEAEAMLKPGSDQVFFTGSGAGFLAPLVGAQAGSRSGRSRRGRSAVASWRALRLRNRWRRHENNLSDRIQGRQEQASIHAGCL